MGFETLLEQLAVALDAAKIPYMVIGGQAVLFYGEPRLTADIDLTLGIGPDRLGDIRALLPALALTPLVSDDFVQQTFVLPCSAAAEPLRVDFLFSFSPYERQAIDRTRRVRMGRAEVRFASPEDLVIHKLVAGRPRDVEDVRGVLRNVADLDVDYTRRWLGEFQALIERPLLEEFEGLYRDRER